MIAEIPIFRPVLPTAQQVLPYLRGIDERRIYTNGGPLVRQLETSYAEFLEVPSECVVAVCSGTAGLMASLLVNERTEWVIPAWTFVATPQSLMRTGKVAIPWDVDCLTATLDTGAVGARPDAGILPVAPFGIRPELEDFADATTLVLDAAASIAVSRGRLSGMKEDWTAVFSLHATKILGCGEGGLVVCGSAHLSARIRSAINFGLNDRVTTRVQGLNAKMSEVTAAYALAALEQAPASLNAWQSQSRKASSISSGLGVRQIAPAHGSIGPYWIVKIAGGRREMGLVQQEMTRRGIQTRRWWPEVVPDMSNVQISPSAVPSPCAADFADTALGLPMSIDQSSSEFDRIGAALEALSSYLEPA